MINLCFRELTRSEVDQAEAVAGEVLDLVQARRVDDADRLLEAGVLEPFGWGGLIVAMMAWCALYIDHVTDGQKPIADSVAVNFMAAQTGEAIDRRDLPDSARWVGRLLSARMRLDLLGMQAEIEDLHRCPPGMAHDRLSCLLGSIALTRATKPRGIALSDVDGFRRGGRSDWSRA